MVDLKNDDLRYTVASETIREVLLSRHAIMSLSGGENWYLWFIGGHMEVSGCL